MPTFGTDATHPASATLIGLATQLLGASPACFGRYFKGPHNPSPVQYQSAQENALLHTNNIRVLCIGRQTNRVGGTQADGVADAVNNMSAIASAFGMDYLGGLGFDPLIFLDTEPETPMSADYYLGWAGALRNQGPGAPGLTLRFTPALYVNRGAAATWNALATALAQGGECAGAWVANYGNRTGAEGPPPWSDTAVIPTAPVPAPCPILAWQYAGDYEGVLDFSTLAEASATDTIGRMILPPA